MEELKEKIKNELDKHNTISKNNINLVTDAFIKLQSTAKKCSVTFEELVSVLSMMEFVKSKKD